jgi:hypothetical protein
MFIATVVVTVLFAAMVAFSAARKLSHKPDVVAAYRRAGVPEDKLNILAFTLLAGVVGLLGGLAWAPIGVAAAGCFMGYFALAIVAHLRANDVANLPTPLALAILAVATLALRLAST